MSKHHMPADVVTILVTQDIVSGEVDRQDYQLLDQDPSFIASQKCIYALLVMKAYLIVCNEKEREGGCRVSLKTSVFFLMY